MGLKRLCYVLPVRRVQLLTVGEAFEDLVFLKLERLPGLGEEIKTTGLVSTVGGGAIITAIAATRLGVRCRTISAVHTAGSRRLRQEGVALTNLRRAGEPHAISISLSTLSDRSFVTFNGINDRLEPRFLRAVKPVVVARHVHFALQPRTCRRWEAVVGNLRRRAITTSWDFGWNDALVRDRHFRSLLKALDYLFLNAQEAQLYARRSSLQAAIDVWRTHPRTVVLKLGVGGSRWLSKGIDLSAPARTIRAVDTTGAGDAFNGGFLAGLLRGLPPGACLRLGNFVGAMSTRSPGGLDGLPGRADVPPSLDARRFTR